MVRKHTYSCVHWNSSAYDLHVHIWKILL